MGYLTIQETMKYTGLSRQTITAYITRGKLTGRKTGNSTSPWLIPAEQVERLRLKRIARLQEQIHSISEPIHA